MRAAGEILNLRWDQIDRECNLIRLEKRQTTAKQARTAPLYGEVKAWLEMAHYSRDPECQQIITYRGHGITEVKTAWSNACRSAGVPSFLIHDPRRTAARNMIRAGVPETHVLLIVGWKTRAMVDRYNITDERDFHVAGEKMQRYFDEKLKATSVRTKLRTTAEIGTTDEIAKPEYLQ